MFKNIQNLRREVVGTVPEKDEDPGSADVFY
jgi:hypothetical protein